MQFLAIEDGNYILNLSQISHIEAFDEDRWDVVLTCGTTFFVEGDGLENLKKVVRKNQANPGTQEVNDA
jgi:glutamate/tyrosine decarboxylase-like PLP-dependent enzyme